MLKEVPKPEAPAAKLSLQETLHKIRPDIDLETIIGLIIDEASYYRDNKDVQRAGARAVNHYYKFGEKEKRKFTLPRLGFTRTLTPSVVTRGRTLYYTTATSDNASWLYRCVFPFKTDGVQSNDIFMSGTNLLSTILIAVFSSKKIVMMRPIYTPTTVYLIQLCRRIGVHVQFDYDDLLLPEFARQRGACRSGLRGHKEDFSESLKQSSLASHAESFTCSTEAIAAELRKINPNVEVRKNKLPVSMFEDQIEMLARVKSKTPEHRKLRILYLSGSNTHKRDFSTIMGPLVRIAQEYPDRFSLTFMGSLSDYSGLFRTLGVRSDVKPSVDFSEMLKIIREHDVVLVPLEFSVFNHCKSNIKYVESACQGVPVIASSVAEFASSIKNGVNGWLCDDEHQWYDTLKKVVLKPRLTVDCGVRAFAHAKAEYSV